MGGESLSGGKLYCCNAGLRMMIGHVDWNRKKINLKEVE